MMQAWTQWLATRSPREQNGIQLALGLLGLWLLWSVAVAPAWELLRHSQAKREQLNHQTALMQQLQQQAQWLRQQTAVSPEQAAQSLQSLSASLGKPISFRRQGLNVSLSFKDASPASLAEFLAQARGQAHTQVLEAHVQQANGVWGGQLMLTRPTPR